MTATAVTPIAASPVPGGDDSTSATPTPKPFQAFTISRCNAYNKTPAALLSETILKAMPSVLRPAPFDGELTDEADIANGEDEEAAAAAAAAANPLEPNPLDTHPLLAVGARATHQFGPCRRYCAVTLAEEGTLVAGSTEFVAEHRGARYLFTTEDKMTAFIANPQRYLPAACPPRCPPPRLWVLGTKASGKKTLTNNLAVRFGIPLFESLDIAYLEALIAAATHSPSGAPAGAAALHIPYQQGSPALDDALAITAQLKAFAEGQEEQQKLKEATIKAQEEREREIEEGEDVDELDEAEEAAIEKALEFEPEEEEVKTERLAAAHRRLAAALTRIEPFASKGYLLIGQPATEADMDGLLNAGAYPDALITTRITAETYVDRLVAPLLKERTAAHAAEVKALRKRRDAQMTRLREREVQRWRRRNIGEDDEEEAPAEGAEDEEEIPEEDPEAPTEEAIRAELEQAFETETAAFAAALDLAPERRIPLISLNANDTVAALTAQAGEELRSYLADRESLLEAPMVIKYKAALSLVAAGKKNLSCFGAACDPVALYHARYDRAGLKADRYTRKAPKDLSRYAPEPEKGLPAAAAGASSSAAPKRRTRTVYRTAIVQNEDGEDEEVEEAEEVEDEEGEEGEEEEEEELAALVEDEGEENANEEEEEDLEPEPEHEPEELAEMAKEHAEATERLRERTYPRAAAFRNRVYFFKNKANLLEFVQNPFRFWGQPPPLAAVPSVTVVTEDLESYAATAAAKKTEGEGAAAATANNSADNGAQQQRPLAHHLACTAGAAFVTVPKLLTWALSRRLSFPAPFDSQLTECLLRGTPLTPSLLTTLLVARLQCADALAGAAGGCGVSGIAAGTGGGIVVSNVLRSPDDYNRLLSDAHGDVEVTAAIGMGATADPVTIMIGLRMAITQHIPTSDPSSTAALVAAYAKVKAARAAQQALLLRQRLGFPSPIHHAAITEAEVSARATVSYKQYCPHTWARRGELVEVGADRQFTAVYEGQFYCFSQRPFLDEFLLHPDRFDKATKEIALPSVLPRRLAGAEAEAAMASVEYVGCCPVTLYDTRDNVGLCGVAEPTAVKGSLVVEYDGKHYAVLSEPLMERFLRQPWVFAEHPVLPPANKLPMEPATVRATPSNEKYAHLALHEPIARAMVEVARVRPKYPGLSADESARKFVALYLRAHNPLNSAFAARQHRENLEEYTEKATLYKTITSTEPRGAADEARFALWDAVQEDPLDYKKYAALRETSNYHADPEAAAATR